MALVAALPILAAGPVHAQPAWVGGEIRLNVRTGPSTDNRIIATIETGDPVQVLQRTKSWTQVVTAEGKQGWVPGGYLVNQAPPILRVVELESELGTLREQGATSSSELAELREAHENLVERQSAQAATLRQLRSENLDLKAGARWPYLITGASILSVGMLIGSFLSRQSARRSRPRIKF